jgi:hypothetical protein
MVAFALTFEVSKKFPASSTAGRLLTIQKCRRDFGSTSTFESIEINLFVSCGKTAVPCDFKLVVTVHAI